MPNDVILIICGLAGVLFHCVLKCKSLLDDARVANINFSWTRDYVSRDAPAIILSVLSVAIWWLLFAEVVATYPKLSAFARTSYVVMGAIGSYLIQLVLSRTKKRIRAVIDQKTNTADNATGDAKTDLP